MADDEVLISIIKRSESSCVLECGRPVRKLRELGIFFIRSGNAKSNITNK